MDARSNDAWAIRADERDECKARVLSKLDELKEHPELQGETGALALALLEGHVEAIFATDGSEDEE